MWMEILTTDPITDIDEILALTLSEDDLTLGASEEDD